jgi:XTP/dITP diphosphohydrolase
MSQYVIASANRDKAAEMRRVLGPLVDGELLDRPTEIPDVDETGGTLEENALLKARAVMQATGLPAIADDTGLEVDALGGAPGVYTARFAGEGATYADNVAKMLRDLDGVGNRRARFRAIAAVAFPDGRVLTAEGAMEGDIAIAPRGSNGFGYDPIFIPTEGDGRTFAEMSPDEKHATSHRGRMSTAHSSTTSSPFAMCMRS